MMEKKTFEALQAAIKFEEDGRAFFLAASERTGEKQVHGVIFVLSSI
jgi:hypothetical protein